MGHKTTQKTNHYILLTNVSIKRCIRPSLKPIFSGGGEEFQPDKYLRYAVIIGSAAKLNNGQW